MKEGPEVSLLKTQPVTKGGAWSNVTASCRGWEVFSMMDNSFTIKIILSNLRQHKQWNINLGQKKKKNVFLFCSVYGGFKHDILEVSVIMRGTKMCKLCRNFKQAAVKVPEPPAGFCLFVTSLWTPHTSLVSWWSAALPKGVKWRQTGQLETSATKGQESEVSWKFEWWKVRRKWAVLTFHYLFIEKSTVSCERFPNHCETEGSVS